MPRIWYQNDHRIMISNILHSASNYTVWGFEQNKNKKTASYIGLTSYTHKVSILRNVWVRKKGHLCIVAVVR